MGYHRTKASHDSGFTLVEMLTVIGIIAVLSAMVITNINESRAISRDVARLGNLKTLENVIEQYFIDHGKYPQTFNNGLYPEIVDPAMPNSMDCPTYDGQPDQHPDGVAGCVALSIGPNATFDYYREKRSQCRQDERTGVPHPTDYIPDIVPEYIGALPSDPKLDCLGNTHSWTYISDGVNYKLVTHVEKPAKYAENVDYGSKSDECNCYPHYGVWSEGATGWHI